MLFNYLTLIINSQKWNEGLNQGGILSKIYILPVIFVIGIIMNFV